MAGEVADEIFTFMKQRMAGLPAGHPFHGKNVADMLLDATGYAAEAEARITKVESAVQRIEARLAEVVEADVDEEALAAALAAHGIGGITPAQLIEVLSTLRWTPVPKT